MKKTNNKEVKLSQEDIDFLNSETTDEELAAFEAAMESFKSMPSEDTESELWKEWTNLPKTSPTESFQNFVERKIGEEKQE